MALIDELQRQGNWLFRWRSYLPFLLVVLVALALAQFDWPFHSQTFHEVWEFACLTISVLGLVIRVLAIGYAPPRTSGRQTDKQVADELNTTGMYSIVRHPLYLGNFLIGFGISLVLLVWWLPVIYTLAFWLYYERIMVAEEAFLAERFARKFYNWSDATPAFWPAIAQWRRPERQFSLRTVLRREYTGMFVIVVGHTFIELSEHLVMFHRAAWEPFWIAFSIAGTGVYLLLRALKKRTSLLDAPSG
jgi:protein-S-isoprenylcysteine O-methyltransferase Ste14